MASQKQNYSTASFQDCVSQVKSPHSPRPVISAMRFGIANLSGEGPGCRHPPSCVCVIVALLGSFDLIRIAAAAESRISDGFIVGGGAPVGRYTHSHIQVCLR